MVAAPAATKRRLAFAAIAAPIAAAIVFAALCLTAPYGHAVAYGQQSEGSISEGASSPGAFQLEAAEPAPGSWVQATPDRLVLHFSVPVVPEQSRVVVTSYRAGDVPGRLEAPEPHRLVFVLDEPLPEATYEVMWEATSEAGSREEGRYSFTYLVPKDDWNEPLDRRLINRMLGNVVPGWVLIIPAVAGVGGLIWVVWSLFRR